jgi:hypothetical protein
VSAVIELCTQPVRGLIRRIAHRLDELKSRMRQCSGMTPGPTIRDETANNSDDAPADGIEGDHADQHDCQHHQGGAALSVAVNPSDHNFGTAD